MTDNRRRITDRDALAILVVGTAMRFGGPLAATILQLLALLAGVAGVLGIVWNKVWLTVLLFVVSWACWWTGERVYDLTQAKPLDQVADDKRQAWKHRVADLSETTSRSEDAGEQQPTTGKTNA